MPPTRTATKMGQPAQPKQTSRKGKKAWRKNVDISSTEAHLEAMRNQAAIPHYDKDGQIATTGKPLYALDNDSLFMEDRSGQETILARRAREKKPLKSLEILNRTSGAAPFTARSRSNFKLQDSTGGKANSAGMSKKQKDRLMRLAGRGDQVRGPMGDQVEGAMSHVGREQSGAVKHAQANLFDVWRQEEDVKGKRKQIDSEDEEWIQVAVKKTIKPPSTFLHDRVGSIARSIPSVSLPHPGMSYNPDLESHERLIQQVYAMEKKLEDSDQMDDAEKKMWAAKIADAKEREAKLVQLENNKRYRGMELDFANEEDLEKGEESSNEEDGDKPKAQKKKTKQQRARAKRHAEEVAKAKARREAKAQAQLVPQIPKLKKRQKAISLARLEAAEQRRIEKEHRIAARGLEGQKLGKHRVLKEKLDVQTGEELSESLRALKPEGNLFRDRYQKMQARALVEPRVPVSKTKRKYDKKTYETHAYKRFV